MSDSLRAAGAAVQTTGTTTTITLPPCFPGDLLVLSIANDSTAVPNTGVTGWDLQFSDSTSAPTLYVYTKRAVASDSGASLAVGRSGASHTWTADVVAYMGVESVESVVSGARASTSAQAFGTPISHLDCWWVAIAAGNSTTTLAGATSTPTGAFTNRAAAGTTTKLRVDDVDAPVTTGAVTATSTGSSFASIGCVLVLRPTQGPFKRAVGSVTNTSSATSVSPSSPSATQAGDLLIAVCHTILTTSTWNTPSGWTLIGQANGVAVFWKIAAAGGATSQAFTISTAASNLYAAIEAYANASTVEASATTTVTSSTAWTAPTVTPLGVGRLLVTAGGLTLISLTGTPDTGMTEDLDSSAVYFAREEVPTAVATGTRAIVASSSGSGMMASLVLAPSTAPALRSAAIHGASGGTSVVQEVPDGTVDGDFLVWCINTTSTITTPAGWALEFADITNTDHLYVFSRTASSEPASYTATEAGSVADSSIMFAVQGTGLKVEASAHQSGNAATTQTAPAATPLRANGLLLIWLGTGSTAGFTGIPASRQLINDQSGTGATRFDLNTAVFFEGRPTSDTTSAVTSTTFSGQNYVGAQIVINAPTANIDSLADTAAATDSVSSSGTRARATADSPTTADSLARSKGTNRSSSDNALTADVLTRSQTEARALADTSAVVDVLARALTQSRTTADTAAALDVLARGAADTRTLDDGTASPDTLTRALAQTRALADNALTADTVTRALAQSRTLADGVTSPDALSRTVATSRQLADTAAASDSLSPVSSHARTAADAVATVDTLARALVESRTLADPSAALDALSRTLALSRVLADPAAATDSLAVLRADTRSAADTATAVDTLSRLRAATRTLADSPTAADTLARAQTATRVLADPSAAIDSLNRLTQQPRTLTDPAATTDAVTRALTQSRTLADAAAESDSLTRSNPQARAATDLASTADTLTATRSKSRTVADTALTGDTLTRFTTTAQAISDDATTDDTLGAVFLRARILADTAGADDVLTFEHIADRAPADLATAADLLAAISTQTRTTADAALSSDTIVGRSDTTRVLADSADGIDLLTPAFTRTRTLADDAPAADTLDSAFTRGRALADSATVVDELVRHVHSRTPPERVLAITGESRVLVVVAEQRLTTIPAEARVDIVPARSAADVIPTESRRSTITR